jgi:hypothetical protein
MVNFPKQFRSRVGGRSIALRPCPPAGVVEAYAGDVGVPSTTVDPE